MISIDGFFFNHHVTLPLFTRYFSLYLLQFIGRHRIQWCSEQGAVNSVILIEQVLIHIVFRFYLP